MYSPRKPRGFSLTELTAATAIILVVTAIALPYLNTAWAGYRLSSAASDVANLLNRTRYEAVKRNQVIVCRGRQSGNTSVAWIDLNNDGNVDPTEPQLVLAGPVQFVPDGVAPSPASTGYPNAQVPPGAVAFDYRGAAFYGTGAPTVYIVYLGYPNQPRYGYRAITLIPAGKTKVWSANAGGSWHSP